MRGWRSVAWLSAVLLAGCRGAQSPAPAKPTPPAAKPAAAPAKPPAINFYESKQPRIQPQQQAVGDHIAGFTWKAAPELADIPTAPLTGRLGGRDFICRYARTMPDEEDKQPTISLRFSSRPRGDRCAFNQGDDVVSLEWHTPVGVGEWHKALGSPLPLGSWAYFALFGEDGVLQTHNPDWGACVKIEEERGSTEAGGLGSYRGRLALVFGDEQKSWVAGTFVADGCHWQP